MAKKKIIQLEKKDSTDTYVYLFESGGCAWRAEIVFSDGKFLKCTVPFHGTWTKKQWEVMGELAGEIERLSNRGAL